MSKSEDYSEYFPYEWRPYQDQFARSIYDALTRSFDRHAVLEAVSGLGKTIAALATVLPIAIANDLVIVFCCRTHRQADRVIEELQSISTKKPVTGISLYGKKYMCLMDRVVASRSFEEAMEACIMMKKRSACKYHKKFLDKDYEIDDIVQNLSSKPISASELINAAKKLGICPYDLAMNVMRNVRVVSLSYKYVFDPEVNTIFFERLGRKKEECIFILDEAHNLPEVASEMLTSRITLLDLKRAREEVNDYECEEDLGILCSVVAHIMEGMVARKRDDELELPVDTTKWLQKLEKGLGWPIDAYLALIDKASVKIVEHKSHRGLLPKSRLSDVGAFLKNAQTTAPEPFFKHVLLCYRRGGKIVSLKQEIIPLDCRAVTQSILNKAYGSVSFSGTLEPIDVYARTVGLPEDIVKASFPSPYPKEQMVVLVSSGVSTSYENRSQKMYQKIARRCIEAVCYTPANVGVFVASFKVMNGLIDVGFPRMVEETGKAFFREEKFMASKENAEILKAFKSYAKKDSGAVLLAVQGGRSSEGVDYPGREMLTAVIVGVPYAEPLPRFEALSEFYTKYLSAKGKEYAYTVPAIRKASQAAGRPIRGFSDAGAIIFMDDRYREPYHRRLIPRWIRENMKFLPDEDNAIASELALFFDRMWKQIGE